MMTSSPPTAHIHIHMHITCTDAHTLVRVCSSQHCTTCIVSANKPQVLCGLMYTFTDNSGQTTNLFIFSIPQTYTTHHTPHITHHTSHTTHHTPHITHHTSHTTHHTPHITHHTSHTTHAPQGHRPGAGPSSWTSWTPWWGRLAASSRTPHSAPCPPPTHSLPLATNPCPSPRPPLNPCIEEGGEGREGGRGKEGGEREGGEGREGKGGREGGREGEEGREGGREGGERREGKGGREGGREGEWGNKRRLRHNIFPRFKQLHVGSPYVN